MYFSIKEVHLYIENMNREVIGRLTARTGQSWKMGLLIDAREDHYFNEKYVFVALSIAAARDKVNKWSVQWVRFNRFVSRLETKLADKRLRFLLLT